MLPLLRPPMLTESRPPVTILSFASLARARRLTQFVTTRSGGVSRPPFHQLNLAFHVGDDPARVAANRRMVCAAMGIPPEALVVASQVHGSRVAVVDARCRGRGALEGDTAIEAADAMVTRTPGLCLLVLTADCVPIVLYDPATPAVGVVHAGWRGTVGEIAARAVSTMSEAFGTSPRRLLAGIGPSIGPCCYEVGPEVLEQVVAAPWASADLVERTVGGKGMLDLWEANRRQLMLAGVPERAIEFSGLCTRCHARLFFSVRHDGATTGRFATGAMLR